MNESIMKTNLDSSSQTPLASNQLNDFLKLIEFAGDAVIMGDNNGILIKTNQKMCDLTGYSRPEIIGMHISGFFTESELKEKPLRFDLVAQNIPILIERNIIKKDGSLVPIEMNSNKIENGYISIIRDITKRKETEKKLAKSIKQLSFVTKMERIGIIDYHVQSKKLSFNEEMCKIMNRKIDASKEHHLNDWLNSIHPDDQYRVKESLERVLDEKVTLEFVYRITNTSEANSKTIKASASIQSPQNEQKQTLIISSVDITNTNTLKTQLRESERTFKSLTDTTPSAIFIYREKFLYINAAFETITGYSKKEASNMSFWEIIHPDQREQVKKRGKQRLQGEIVTKRYEMKIVSKNGETKWIEFAGDQIIFLGKPAGLGTAFDITARKRMESINKTTLLKLEEEKQKAIESEHRFRHYIDQNTAAMLVVEPTTKKIIFSNRAAADLYGYTKDEFLQMSIYNISTLTADEINIKMTQAIKSSSNKFQFKHRTKNNKIIDTIVNANPVLIDNQITMVLIIRDITENIHTKDQLQKSHDTYRNILNSLSEMVYVIDKDSKFKFVNETAKNIYGYNKIDFIGKTPAFLSAPGKNNISDVVDKIGKAYNGSTEIFEFWGLKKNKDVFPKEVILTPGFFFGEKVVIAVARDITQQKKNTTELILAKEKAEENDQLKSTFLANMSHEIRTPMNAILGFSELVNEPEIDHEERKRFLKIINKSSYHLLNLINDLVDISKFQSQQMKIFLTPVKLNELLNEMRDYFNGELLNNSKHNLLKLTFNLGLEDAESMIKTDSTRLQQILNNIIGNAIKFTESGEIHISYKVKNDMLHFKVLDDGIGIVPDQQERIFERFSQADSTISKEYGGTGLGLSISKACIDLLGGNIWCESRENIGTKMQFTIPYIQA